MPFLFTMPKLSPTMEEGTIAKWFKKEGDFVNAGEVLIEVATDKATVEHTNLDEGFLRKILIQEGQSAAINQPLAIFTQTKDESIEGFLKKEEPKTQSTPQTTQEAPRQVVERKEPLFVPEAPLADFSIEEHFETKERIKASPLAKRLAEEQGIDLSTVKGTGPHGRITSEDLVGASKETILPGKNVLPQERPGSYEEIPLKPVRKVIAKRLQESKSYIPHFYVKQTIDAAPLWDLYEQLKKFNLKITVNDLIIRAAALALRKHPEVNSGFNSQSQSIIRFKTIDISVAVSFSEGLITPIIRYADFKDLTEISTEIRALAERARLGKLKEQEYKGGSFSISNMGMYGISEFIAVINPPQAAILAVGGIEQKAVVKEGKVVPGKTLDLNLSVDHRVIDGADGAKFLKTLQSLLEQPVILTL